MVRARLYPPPLPRCQQRPRRFRLQSRARPTVKRGRGWRLRETGQLAMRPALEYARRLGRFQRNARLYLINNALSGVTAGIVLVLYNLYLYSLGYGTDFVGFVLLRWQLAGVSLSSPQVSVLTALAGRLY